MGSPERTKIEINRQAEALLTRIVGKASVLKEREKIPIFSGRLGKIESTGNYGSYSSTHYSLFLTREGLIEQKRVLEYINAADGFPFDEDKSEYSVQPYFLVQQYNPDEDDSKALEGLLHQLQSRMD